MAVEIPAKLATTYECLLRTDPNCAPASAHDSGTGRPPRKRCRYCHGDWFIQSGMWAVCRWREDGDYRLRDAISLHRTSGAADAATEGLDGDEVCVRWLSAYALGLED